LTEKTESILHKNCKIQNKRKKDSILVPYAKEAKAWAEPPVIYEAQRKNKKSKENSNQLHKSAGYLGKVKSNPNKGGAQVLPDSVPMTGTMYNQFFKVNPEASPMRPLAKNLET